MLFRYKINPVSPVITPLMSDTFFGHFCWAVLFEKGEAFLEKLLASYGKEKPAPVLFSSAFVSGWLPRPALPPAKREQTQHFVEKYFVDNPPPRYDQKTKRQKRFEGMKAVKKWNKQSFLPLSTWMALKNNYSEVHLLEIFYDKFKHKKDDEYAAFETEVTASNSISRTSGMVSEEGGLFQREKTWYHKNTELDLYVKIGTEEMIPLVQWFLTDYLPLNGFGKDKSVGMGCLRITPDDAFESDAFNAIDANAHMVLSATSFEGIEKYAAYYRLMTKFGKLGGNFAVSSPSGGPCRPFKKPILMIEPGSVFFTCDDLSGKPLLKNIHSDERVHHCGVPVTLPIKIMEDNLNVTI